MRYTVRAFLLRADGKAITDLGRIGIEVRGPLTRGAAAKFRYLNRTEIGTIDQLERHSEGAKVPTVHIVQSLGD